MKVTFFLALGLLALAGACSAPPEKIAFSDDSEIRAAAASANVSHAPVARRLEKADELKVEQAVFSYLLDRHFWDLADYSAVFLQTDDAQVRALIKKYPGHVPPIKPSSRAEIQSHRAPRDRDTNKPALILSAEITDPNADGSVDAVGRWYAGDTVTGFRALHLQKVNNEWQVAEVK
jgi:hypothetical protein